METIEIMGLIGNLILLSGPVSELFRIVVLKQSLKHNPSFIFLIVLGIMLNTAYLASITVNLPIFNIIQNLIAIVVWLFIYEFGR